MQLLWMFMLFVSHFAAFKLAFSSKTYCIQRHFTLRLAPKRLAFSGKTHCIQHQNALRLAAYCRPFSYKQAQNRRKWQFHEINIHFAASACYLLLASKPTFARIDYLRQGRRLVEKKGTHNVKIRTKKKTKSDGLTSSYAVL